MNWRLFRALGMRSLLLLTVLPGVVALAISSYHVYRVYEDASNQDLLSRVRSISQLVDQQLMSVQRSLELLAGSGGELRTGNLRAFHAKLSEAKSVMPWVDVVQLYAPNGKILLSSAVPLDSPLPTSKAVDQIVAVAEQGAAKVGSVIVGTVSRRTLVPIYVPVRVNGVVAFVLSAGIYCDQFNELLSHHSFPGKWIAVIYDRSGTVAGRSLNPEDTVGKQVAPALIDWLNGPNERIGEGRTLEGRLSVAAMHRSELSQYSVTASVPKNVLIAPLRTNMLISSAAVMAGLVAGAFLAWQFVQGVRRSLKELQQATQSIAAGQTGAVKLPTDSPQS